MAGSKRYHEHRVLGSIWIFAAFSFSCNVQLFNISIKFEGPPKIRWKENSSASVPRSVLLPLQRYLGSKACTPKHFRPGCSVTERCSWLCPSQAKSISSVPLVGRNGLAKWSPIHCISNVALPRKMLEWKMGFSWNWTLWEGLCFILQ